MPKCEPPPACPPLLHKAREEEHNTCNDVNVQNIGIFQKVGGMCIYMHTKTVSARFFSPSLEKPT